MTINNRGADWLEQRGLDVEIAIRFGLYTCSRPGGEPSTEEGCDWIAVPYKVDDQVVNVKFRRLSEKAHAQTQGGKQVLWNRNVIRDQTLKDYPLIITEGEWDALACIEAGFPRVVSVPGGAPQQAGQKGHAYIDDAMPDLKEVDRIIIATDSDEPGCALREDLIARLGRARCMALPYPKGCKDLGDALRLYGIKGVQAALAKAKLVPMGELVELDDIPERPPLNPVKLRSLGADFHNHIGICKGQTSVWTGEANGGKSTLLRCVSWALAMEKDWRTAPAFFEDDIRQNVVPALVRLHSNGWPVMAEDRDGCHDWIREHYKFILPREDEPPTLPWLLDMAEGAVRRFGCDLIICDPWTDLELGIGSGMSETEIVRGSLGVVKRFARKFNCHFAIIAHPRKHGEYGGTKKMADGADISGSGHFKNRLDLGVTVQADPTTDNVTNIRVWKSKYREEMGQTGDFSLLFDPRSRRFGQIQPHELKVLRGETEEEAA